MIRFSVTIRLIDFDLHINRISLVQFDLDVTNALSSSSVQNEYTFSVSDLCEPNKSRKFTSPREHRVYSKYIDLFI